MGVLLQLFGDDELLGDEDEDEDEDEDDIRIKYKQKQKQKGESSRTIKVPQ